MVLGAAATPGAGPAPAGSAGCDLNAVGTTRPKKSTDSPCSSTPPTEPKKSAISRSPTRAARARMLLRLARARIDAGRHTHGQDRGPIAGGKVHGEAEPLVRDAGR